MNGYSIGVLQDKKEKLQKNLRALAPNYNERIRENLIQKIDNLNWAIACLQAEMRNDSMRMDDGCI